MAAQPMRIVVTGASRGLGLEFCRQYLDQGHEVAALARSASTSQGLKDLADEYGGRLLRLDCDISDDESVQKVVGELKRRWDHLDLLVNNAGVGGDKSSFDTLLFEDDLMRTFSVNTVGPLRMTRALLPLLEKGTDAKVANITSRMGSIDDNSSGGSWSYRISKAALNMAVRNLAHELRDDEIATVVLHPGWVRTDMGGSHAPLSTEESVAGMIKVIDKLDLQSSGQFLGHQGEPIPW